MMQLMMPLICSSPSSPSRPRLHGCKGGGRDGAVLLGVYRKTGNVFARSMLRVLRHGSKESEREYDLTDRPNFDVDSPCTFLRETRARGAGNALRWDLGSANVTLLGTLAAAGEPFRLIDFIRAPSSIVVSDYHFCRSGAEVWMRDGIGDNISKRDKFSSRRDSTHAVLSGLVAKLREADGNNSLAHLLAAQIKAKASYQELLLHLDMPSGVFVQAHVSRDQIVRMLANERALAASSKELQHSVLRVVTDELFANLEVTVRAILAHLGSASCAVRTSGEDLVQQTLKATMASKNSLHVTKGKHNTTALFEVLRRVEWLQAADAEFHALLVENRSELANRGQWPTIAPVYCAHRRHWR